MDPTPDTSVFKLVLKEELRRPVALTADEIAGGWRQLFPDLAGCLPTPYPIFGHDEEQVVTHGYPVLRSDGIFQLERHLDNLMAAEVDYRVAGELGQAFDKRSVMAERDRIHRSLSVMLENALMNDYGRGMAEVCLLYLSAAVARSTTRVPKLVRLADRLADAAACERQRQAVAGAVGGLIQRAAHSASDHLRSLAQVRLTPKVTPLLSIVCTDPLLLTEARPSADMPSLDGYLQHRFKIDLASFERTLDRALSRLSQLMSRRPEVGRLLTTATGINHDLTSTWTMLEPRLLSALANAQLLDSVGLTKSNAALLRELGLTFKRFELLAALRRRIVILSQHGDQLVLTESTSRRSIAPTTRPYDFTAPGVVDNSVRRFGLVYDLTNFTATLEDVRKKGRMAEEKALQFMYVFQNRLEEIRHDHRLIFEKFLGDGAFYSSRRALRTLAAACRIQHAYDRLRRSGFPFDQGIRIALNHAVYRLLPMLGSDREIRRFEFFGHGIVELARLTTGKSTREVAEIAEFLIRSGYDNAEVESFLAPLARARGVSRASDQRRYTASLDEHGELVNEGIVLTWEFVEQLEAELDAPSFEQLTEHDVTWLLLPLDPTRPGSWLVGLRALGVARLKGLDPIGLAEAAVWTERPDGAIGFAGTGSLTAALRFLQQSGAAPQPEIEPDTDATIDADLVVLTYLDRHDTRRWIFGRHRASDDVLLKAVQMPMQLPSSSADEALETWLFRNRFELEQLYHSVYGTDGGSTIPVGPLRRRNGYVACFLAAPYKAP